jgi:rubredoxin
MLDIKSILARQDLLYRNVPRCPACGADQVQIMQHEQPAEWRCRECRHRFAFEPAPLARHSVRSPGAKVAAVVNIECPRCGVARANFAQGVCRACFMPDYHRRRSVSPSTVSRDSYGQRLCIECRGPGSYAHGLCAKCYMRDYRRRRRMLLTCAICGVSFQSARRDALHCSLSCRLRARRGQSA